MRGNYAIVHCVKLSEWMKNSYPGVSTYREADMVKGCII